MFYIAVNVIEGIFLSTFLSTSAYSLYCPSSGIGAAIASGTLFWIIREIRETSELPAMCPAQRVHV